MSTGPSLVVASAVFSISPRKRTSPARPASAMATALRNFEVSNATENFAMLGHDSPSLLEALAVDFLARGWRHAIRSDKATRVHHSARRSGSSRTAARGMGATGHSAPRRNDDSR